MHTYWFEDIESGEEFFVEADTVSGAKKIAKRYFDAPALIEEVEYEVAEAMGLDTY